MRVLAAALACGIVLAAAGCAGNDRDQITNKVQELARAVGDRDYKRICDDVLAPSLVAHLVKNGIACRSAMQVALQGVREPVVSIGKITIRGSRATAITLTVAQGQRASLAAIELVKTGDGWRISNLGSPLTAAGG